MKIYNFSRFWKRVKCKS